MFASRITISEETKKQNQLSKRQQGKLRYERLAEPKKPDYGFENVKKAHLKMKAEEKAKEIILKEKLEEVEKLSNLTITKGDLSISTTLGQDNIVRVITSIFN